jgi:hypothetical protein
MSLRKVQSGRPLAGHLARLALGVALALGVVTAAPPALQAQETAALSPDGLRDLAFRLLQDGQPAQALDLVTGLIARVPCGPWAGFPRPRAPHAKPFEWRTLRR